MNIVIKKQANTTHLYFVDAQNGTAFGKLQMKNWKKLTNHITQTIHNNCICRFHITTSLRRSVLVPVPQYPIDCGHGEIILRLLPL